MHLIVENETSIQKEQKLHVMELNNQINSLILLFRIFFEDTKQNINPEEKEEHYLQTMFVVTRLYFISVSFVREFNRITDNIHVTRRNIMKDLNEMYVIHTALKEHKFGYMEYKRLSHFWSIDISKPNSSH